MGVGADLLGVDNVYKPTFSCWFPLYRGRWLVYSGRCLFHSFTVREKYLLARGADFDRFGIYHCLNFQ
jgi:hypothetical protein